MTDYIDSKGGDYNPINESIVDQNDPTSESYVKREDAIDFGADLDLSTYNFIKAIYKDTLN